LIAVNGSALFPLTVSTVFPEQTVETVQETDVPLPTAMNRGVNEKTRRFSFSFPPRSITTGLR
jgi:hypothetical protein